ncbi:hypothetical protein FOA43_001582 [Brettanomyces nanus]|uniref:FYVE-type domain-containing protein n=1 Tax=Eeniella nana TaxID=13502 RepID=A0A875RU75_EENNA|nr:uncharacterized protein FOA43_001582 [Brettanomyces nanus]QPG74257.1 hypothetical protein FOA43_001582 [Brettanomyces nanus]
MLTLAQLNQHLDDEHTLGTTSGNSDESANGNENEDENENKRLTIGIEKDFKNWFKENFIGPQQQQQPSSPRKFKADIFDSNFSLSESSRSSSPDGLQKKSSSSSSRHPIKNGVVPVIIPRAHWQKPSGNSYCHYEGCNKNLGLKNGQVNCRKCGRLFCDYHTLYRMKINAKLESDVENGVWSRVCVDCFQQRPCWERANDGQFRDLTVVFKRLRDKKVGTINLGRLNLEKRLIKFLNYLELVGEGKKSLSEFYAFERDLVPWQDAAKYRKCSVCQSPFSFFVRKHHCRICGSVVCGDPSKGCSMPVPANLIAGILNIRLPGEEKDSQVGSFEGPTGNITIRLCLLCKRRIFDRRLASEESVKLDSSDFIITFKRFLALRTQVEKARGVADELKLIGYFTKIEQLLKVLSAKVKVLDNQAEEQASTRVNAQTGQNIQLPNKPFNVDQYRLYRSLEQRIVSYIQENLPELRRIQQSKIAEEKKLIGEKEEQQDGAPKLTKREIRLKREKLMVLNEQKFMIQNLHEEYKKQRKFDDLQPLDDNLSDLRKEIEGLRLELGDEAF